MPSFESKIVFTQTRLMRRAILVPPDLGLDGVLEIFDKLSCLWGGHNTILIPTDGRSVHRTWSSHLKIFDPDIIISALPGGQLSRKAESSILGWCAPLCQYDEWLVPEGMMFWSGETPLKSALLGLLGSDKAEVMALEVEGPVAMQAFFAGRFGVGGPSLEASLKAQDRRLRPEDATSVPFFRHAVPAQESYLSALLWMYRRLVPSAIGSPDEEEPLPKDASSEFHWIRIIDGLPFALSRLGTEEAYNSRELAVPHLFDLPSVCVVGDTLRDFALSYNLGLMRHRTTWLPITTPPDDDDHGPLALLVRALAMRLALDNRRPGTLTPATSTSLNRTEVKDAVRWIAGFSRHIRTFSSRMPRGRKKQEGWQRQRQREVRESIVSSLRPARPERVRPFTVIRRFSGTQRVSNLNFSDAKSVMDIPLEPPPLKQSDASRLNWIGEISIEGYRLPQRSELSASRDSVKQLGLGGIDDGARVSSLGLAFIATKLARFGEQDIHGIMSRPVVTLRPPLDIFGLILGKLGYSVTISEKGQYLLQMASRAVSIRNLSEVLEMVHTRKLLLTAAGLRAMLEPLVGVLSQSGRYLTAHSVHDALAAWGDVNPSVTLGGLMTSGWIDLGNVLKCRTCRQTDWYSNQDVGNSFVCHRCASSQPVAGDAVPLASSRGPVYFYRLNALAYMFLKNGGDVTARAVGLIEKDGREPLFFIPEFELRPLGGGAAVAEFDILASWGGALAMGECKRTWKMDSFNHEERARKLRKYESMLRGIRPDRFVLASEEPMRQNQYVQAFVRMLKRLEIEPVVIAPEAYDGTLRIQSM